MKILITGSNGFVGSHIAEFFSKTGHEVICLVRKTSNRRWLDKLSVNYRIGDVTNPETLPEVVKDTDIIIHSAAILRARKKETYYNVNQKGTKNLVEAILNHNPKLKKFVYISSQAAMGPSKELKAKPLNEEETPVSDYGKSKLAGEKELTILEGKIPFTIFRPPSIYGPRDKDIFIFFNLVNLGLKPVPLKKRYIQMLYVEDLAKAVLNSLENDKTNNKKYLIAEDTFYTWDTIAKTIAESVGKKIIPLPLPNIAFYFIATISELISFIIRKPAVLNYQKINEMLQTYWLGDTEPAKKDLKMDFTNLNLGAKITYSWYKNNSWF